jgi:hypothetical protein
MSPDGDVTLISNSDGWFPTQRTTGTEWIGGAAGQPERTDWEKNFVTQFWERLRADHKVVNK